MKVHRLALPFGLLAACAACFAPSPAVTTADSVAPSTLYTGSSTQLTITGDFWAHTSTSFGPGTQMHVDDLFTASLGTTQLTHVAYLDAQTLQAELPANAEVGLHTLTVTGPDGSSATLLGAATILPQVCRHAQCSGGFSAAIAINAVQGTPSTRFQAVGSYTPTAASGSRIYYLWDWNSDGHFDAHGAHASHKFKTPGAYTVTLVVADELGNAGQSQTDIVVMP